MKKYLFFYLIVVLYSLSTIHCMEIDNTDKSEFSPQFIEKAQNFLYLNKDEMSDQEKNNYINAVSFLSLFPVPHWSGQDPENVIWNSSFYSEKTDLNTIVGFQEKKNEWLKKLELETEASISSANKTYCEMLRDIFVKGYPLPQAIWNYTDVIIPYGCDRILKEDNEENIEEIYKGHPENFYTIKANNGYEFYVAKTLLNMRWEEFIQKRNDFVGNSKNKKFDENCITIFYDQDAQVVEALIEKSVYERIDSASQLPVILPMLKLMEMLKLEHSYSLCLNDLARNIFSGKIEYSLESVWDILELLTSKDISFHRDSRDKKPKITANTSIEELLSFDDKDYFILDDQLMQRLEGDFPNDMQENDTLKYFKLNDKEEQIENEQGKYRKVTRRDVSRMLAEKLVEPFFKTPAIFETCKKSTNDNNSLAKKRSKVELINSYNQESFRTGISVYQNLYGENRRNNVMTGLIGYPYEDKATKTISKDKPMRTSQMDTISKMDEVD